MNLLAKKGRFLFYSHVQVLVSAIQKPKQIWSVESFSDFAILNGSVAFFRRACFYIPFFELWIIFYSRQHRMDKRKSFVFARQYRNCFSRRINPLAPRNQPIKTAVGIMMHDVHGLKTMSFHHVADIAYF